MTENAKNLDNILRAEKGMKWKEAKAIEPDLGEDECPFCGGSLTGRCYCYGDD